VDEFFGIWQHSAAALAVEPSGADDRVSGAYEARELFARMQAPLLHDRPLARDLTLIVGARWSDYSSFDANLSWQAGLRWQPAAEMTLRANYAEVFRAPNIVELYDPRVRFEGYWDLILVE
jgi:outer membrane cobalamin receptor